MTHRRVLFVPNVSLAILCAVVAGLGLGTVSGRALGAPPFGVHAGDRPTTLPGILIAGAEDPTGKGYVGEWVVFADAATVRVLPTTQSASLGTLAKGTPTTGDVLLVPESAEEWLRLTYRETTGYVSLSTIHRIHPQNFRRGNLPIGTEVVSRWWGLPINYEPSDLQPIPSRYLLNPRRNGMVLRAEALAAFMDMADAGERDGVHIRIASAYRSGPTQLRIYERNIGRSGIGQRYSAAPGHSEHQLGTTMDLADAAGRHVLTKSFETTPESRWLEAHAARYGFRRSYYENNVDQTGYVTEPWHWRYWGRPPEPAAAGGGQ